MKPHQSEPQPPVAFLFCNGNAAFMDKNGKQMGHFQSHGWKGLHLFLKEYPDAAICIQGSNELPKDLYQYFLKNIAMPDRFDPQPGG